MPSPKLYSSGTLYLPRLTRKKSAQRMAAIGARTTVARRGRRKARRSGQHGFEAFRARRSVGGCDGNVLLTRVGAHEGDEGSGGGEDLRRKRRGSGRATTRGIMEGALAFHGAKAHTPITMAINCPRKIEIHCENEGKQAERSGEVVGANLREERRHVVRRRDRVGSDVCTTSVRRDVGRGKRRTHSSSCCRRPRRASKRRQPPCRRATRANRHSR